MRRELQNKEAIEGLIEILIAEGILEEAEGEYFKTSREPNEVRELARGLANRAGRNNDSND